MRLAMSVLMLACMNENTLAVNFVLCFSILSTFFLGTQLISQLFTFFYIRYTWVKKYIIVLTTGYASKNA